MSTSKIANPPKFIVFFALTLLFYESVKQNKDVHILYIIEIHYITKMHTSRKRSIVATSAKYSNLRIKNRRADVVTEKIDDTKKVTT